MISSGLLRESFRRRAMDAVIYRSIKRAAGELNVRPRISYENRELFHVVIRQRNGIHTDSVRGVYVEGELEITWNPLNPVIVQPGDRINIGGELRSDGTISGGEDHEILKHYEIRRIKNFVLQRFHVARILNDTEVSRGS